MGRLRKRLEKYQPQTPNQPQYDYDVYPEGYIPPEQAYEQYDETPLAREYDELQQRVQQRHRERVELVESTNPHTLYKDIVTNPSPKGKHPMTIMGRPLDLAKLENYLVYKISPKTITTLIRYGDARAIEDIKGYSKRSKIKFKGGMIWIILGAIIILILGYLLFTTDMTSLMGGLFGGI